MKNVVELMGVYGNDLTHALSAWTSTDREMTPEKVARIPALLKKLVEGSDGNSHGTPFEKSAIHFLTTTEVASHIHIIKHRIGVSVNAESARYKELKEDRFYIPDDWPDDWQNALRDHTQAGLELYHTAVADLQNYGISKKRAKESARYFRGYNTQLASDVMFNFRSFALFQKLRNTGGAQREIREIADEMLRLVRATGEFKHSLEAWGL